MTDKPQIEYINALIAKSGVDTNQISDGYHTFGELYEHRIALFIALCHVIPLYPMTVWKSFYHSDGTFYSGWFIAGIGIEKGSQISYHLPMKYWDKLQVPAFDKAPEWDGHTSQDVIERLLDL